MVPFPMEPEFLKQAAAETHRTEQPCGDRIPSSLRWHLAIVAAVAATLIVVARQLDPDPRGYGTHEQLGLAPCWFRQRFAMPCLTCGMTTSFAHALRGDLRSAASANLAGALLAASVMAVMIWSLSSAATGKWVLGRPKLRHAVWLSTWILCAALLDWIRRLVGVL